MGTHADCADEREVTEVKIQQASKLRPSLHMFELSSFDHASTRATLIAVLAQLVKFKRMRTARPRIIDIVRALPRNPFHSYFITEGRF